MKRWISKIIFPFGGQIVDTGVACKLHYWVLYFVWGIPVTHPGIPIPIVGTRIDVSLPGIPAEDIFTFPYISRIYANYNQNKVGVWTLGLALKNEWFEKAILDPINKALDNVIFSIGIITFYNFSLNCPDGGPIYKIGTSGDNLKYKGTQIDEVSGDAEDPNSYPEGTGEDGPPPSDDEF